MTSPGGPPSRAAVAAAFGLRAVLFAGAWWVLAEGRPIGPLVAVLGILASVAASLALVPAGTWRWTVLGFLRFVPFFVTESLRGGSDVARRALHPRLPVEPGLNEYRMRIPEGAAQVFFANTVSLLPGTLSVRWSDGRLTVHVLDRKLPLGQKLRRLEERVADLFGVPLA